MSDTLGNVSVPDMVISGTFPLVADYPFGRIHAPETVSHLIGNTSSNLKISQRFYLGQGVRKIQFRRNSMTETARNALRVFWENRSGPYEGFVYACPNENGSSFTNVNVRFENAPLTWEWIASRVTRTSITFLEIPSSFPTYSLNSTQTRFPSGGLPAALLAQVQELIPLVKITVTEPGYPAMYVSDRRCTIGAQLYQARLWDWDGIQQGLGGESDQASFVLGNADRVMTAITNDTDLYRASVEFSLFHVGTGIKIDLWKGEVSNWKGDCGPEFSLEAVDGLYELNLPYPVRRVSRTCWKDFNDGAGCPAAANGGLHLGELCDKGFDTEKGCVYHNMIDYFGGIVAKVQPVRTKDNANSGLFGFGRSPLTTSSLIADSIYDEVVPEVYTDIPFPVNGKIIAGRDEGDFYTALAILSEGPIGAMEPGFDVDGNPRHHLLDGQPNHGPYDLGLRRGNGHDPVQADDWDRDSKEFSLGQGGAGLQTYGGIRAAGTAFIEIRRTDYKGLQLSRLTDHQLQAYISVGLRGWVWTAPNTRSVGTLTNPVWIVVNALLRARGLRFANAATAENYFDVTAAIAAAAICDLSVTSLVDPDLTETQFKFIGVIQQEKPLKDWIAEILMNCNGYYTFSFGKLRIGIRYNSSAVEAFTEGNIVYESLQLGPIKPAFNHLTANFADGEFDFVGNSVTVYDIDYAKRIGGATSPLFLKSTLNLSGTPSKSQAARVVATRVREESGGVYRSDKARPALEFSAARNIAFKTTVLALNTEPGRVCSLTHADMPTYQASNDGQAEADNYGEFRVVSWRLNKDYSIDIQGLTTHNDIYDLTFGPKPADVVADDIPVEQEYAPADWSFRALTHQEGVLRLRDFNCAVNPGTVHRGFFEVYYVPESASSYARLVGDIDDAVTSLDYEGESPVVGEWLLLESEIMEVTSVTPTSLSTGACSVLRGQFGTTAAAHNRVSTSVLAKVGNADITVGAGLELKPGNRLFTDPAGAQRTIAEYDSVTGVLRTTLPYGIVNVSDDVYSDPRLFRVSLRNEVIDFQPRFFKSPNRAEFEYLIDLPCAGVVAVLGILENTRGILSDPVIVGFTEAFPFRLRTLGSTQYALVHPAIPIGNLSNGFESVKTAHRQSFQRAYVEVVSPEVAESPLPIPRAVSAITLAKKLAGGTIQIGGTISANGRIHVVIGNGTTEKTYVEAPVFVLTSEATAADVATSLAAWLNATEEFAAFFLATEVGSQVQITDLSGNGGTIVANTDGGVTATVAGLISWLGVRTGRKYAVSFYGADSDFDGESELSPLSVSTGPTGGASRVEIKDVPVPTDGRLTETRVYAAPDGQESPFYRIAVTTDSMASDTVTEASLTSQPAYGGAAGPDQPGDIRVTVKQDGENWLEMRVPINGSRSNVIAGMAMDQVAEGTLLTASVDNSANESEIKVILQ